MNIKDADDVNRRPVPAGVLSFDSLFELTKDRRPPSKRLRMWVAMTVVAMFVMACAVAPIVCPEGTGWFRVFIAVLCGTFGRMVIGGGHNGISGFDYFCVSMAVCSAICFWGRCSHKSEGCISAFFLFSWFLWFFGVIAYFSWWR